MEKKKLEAQGEKERLDRYFEHMKWEEKKRLEHSQRRRAATCSVL